MRLLALISCFVFLIPALAQEQQPLITPDTPVTTDTLHQWLHSTDPRLIAWAADFARRNHDPAILAELPSLLEHWAAPSISVDNAYAPQTHAIDAILDALIQENVQVPASTVHAVAGGFPAQASILVGRLPLSDSRPTLHDWTYETTGTWGARMLARVATMMLAAAPAPDPDIVGVVIKQSQVELSVSIYADGSHGESYGVGPSCGDSLPSEPTPGWPQVYEYDLIENDSYVRNPLVIDLDGDHIAYRRFEDNHHPGTCYGVEPLNPVTRHRLLAHWLGISPKEMPWQPVEGISIVWTTRANYEQELGAFIESERQKLEATVLTLRQRDILSTGNTTVMHPELMFAPMMPRMIITIQCRIDTCPLDPIAPPK